MADERLEERIKGFNPTLVRLRPGFEAPTDSENLFGFNPTLVRLRLSEGGLWLACGGRFQSHAGSIEAQDAARACGSRKGFNPTLVRLRRGKAVRIYPVMPCFNPTLVRLRPSCPPCMVDSARMFQSHAGSIEAGCSARLPNILPVVSIPRWFD